jgi:hypothetical protein
MMIVQERDRLPLKWNQYLFNRGWFKAIGQKEKGIQNQVGKNFSHCRGMSKRIPALT